MEGLRKQLDTKEGKIHIFKQLRQSIIDLTDGVMNEDMQEYDLNCAFGGLASRMREVSRILQNQKDEKQRSLEHPVDGYNLSLRVSEDRGGFISSALNLNNGSMYQIGRYPSIKKRVELTAPKLAKMIANPSSAFKVFLSEAKIKGQ